MKNKSQQSVQVYRENMNKRTTNLKLMGLCIMSLAGLVVASQSDAVTFGVRVVDEFKQPIPQASVCMGTGAKLDQFAAATTDSDGVVLVEVPSIPFKVTVSKGRYQGIEIFEPVRSYTLIKEITLLEDGIGPICHTASISSEISEKAPLVITKLAMKNNAGMIVIDSKVDGEPSHYRISHNKDFKGATWRTYKPSAKYSGTAKDGVYFQVRRYKRIANGGWLEARSDVANIIVVN